MSMEKKKEFVINCLYTACWLVITYVGFKYMLPIFVPFLLGFLVSTLSHKITKNQSTWMLVIIYISLGILLTIIIITLISSVQNLIATVPNFYRNSIEPLINDIYNQLARFAETLDVEIVRTSLETALDFAKTAVSSLGSYLVSMISSAVFSLPNVVMWITIFIVSSFYFTADYDRVWNFFEKHFSTLTSFCTGKLSIVIVAYAKIMALTAAEVFVGLIILRIPNALLLSILTSIVDIMPILGTGTVLIPWAIVSLVTSHYVIGIGLLVLYIVITVVRQYVEPLVVGKELGISPIVSLISMVVGLNLFGLPGMIGFPLIAAFIMYQQEANSSDGKENLKISEESQV